MHRDPKLLSITVIILCFTIAPLAIAQPAQQSEGQAEQRAANVSPAIRLNTVGYLPQAQKRASIAAEARRFELVRAGDGTVVLQGPVTGPFHNPGTDEQLYLADFSTADQPGRYYLNIPGVGRSPAITIEPGLYNQPFELATEAMYLWRCGMAVSGEHEGHTFAHGPCHLQDAYLDYVGGGHEIRDGVGGWHDAGDYNKYVVNAGVTVGMMLQAWDQFGDKLRNVSLDIPESDNDTPDYLDEVRYELEWLLKMQADDGRVYHKLSTEDFGGFVPPEEQETDRFFTPWSSAATADFTAMMAMAARIYQPHDADFAQRCLTAAKKSYDFLAAHPENHRADLEGFSTGAYQTDDPDDRLWAAAEMWRATGEPQYLEDFEQRIREMDGSTIDANWDWSNVKNLGTVTYLLADREGRDPAVVAKIREDLLTTADAIAATADNHGYARPLGDSYYWGVNGTVARQALILHVAHRFSDQQKYISTALDSLNHLLGRNYYGRSFVTGLGHNPPMFPHDRRSGGDDVKPPWPGYLVGGGHPGPTDWVDVEESYRTNEVAINWNGALIYALAAFMEPEASNN